MHSFHNYSAYLQSCGIRVPKEKIAGKPNIHEVEEEKEEVTVLPPPSNFIPSEEEIEICETTDVWECDDVLKYLLKPYRC